MRAETIIVRKSRWQELGATVHITITIRKQRVCTEPLLLLFMHTVQDPTEEMVPLIVSGSSYLNLKIIPQKHAQRRGSSPR